MGLNAGDTAIAPGDPASQIFAAGGTWNKPNGVRAVRVRVIGGGAGSGGCLGAGTGASASGGGGAGGYAEQVILAANLLSSETVTIGAAGAAGASGNNSGGNGGTSSFGAHCSATGGVGGSGHTSTTGSTPAAGGVGGSGSGGDLNVSGDQGGNGGTFSGAPARTADGGGNPLASRRRPSTSPSTPVAGAPYGGGGAGIINTTVSGVGSAGAAGVVIVENIF